CCPCRRSRDCDPHILKPGSLGGGPWLGWQGWPRRASRAALRLKLFSANLLVSHKGELWPGTVHTKALSCDHALPRNSRNNRKPMTNNTGTAIQNVAPMPVTK